MTRSPRLSADRQRGSVEFRVGYLACGLTAAKSSLPAIRKMTVLIVSKLEQPRARRLAAWNRPPERLEEAVGLAGLGPGDDALQMPTHHGGDVFHRLDLGAHDAGAPAPEHSAHHVDLPALEDLAQLLLVDPGAGGAHGGHPGDERILSRPQPQGEGANDPSAATSACPSSDSVCALLDAPHPVHRCVGMPDDVELVEGDAGVGQLLGAALDGRPATWSMLTDSICSGGQPCPASSPAMFSMALGRRAPLLQRQLSAARGRRRPA